MWHVLHLIARPIEVLLGLFCVLTAIVLYPGEEGKIQSKFEDLWIRVDDYHRQALSRHAAFMQQVAQLETRFLDRLFGHDLISTQALGISFCYGYLAWSLWGPFLYLFSTYASNRVELDVLALTQNAALIALPLVAGAAIVLSSKHKTLQRRITVTCAVGIFAYDMYTSHDSWHGIFYMVVSIFDFIGGFFCDVAFVVITRRLLRWAGQMISTLKITTAVSLNLLMAIVLISPLLLFNPFSYRPDAFTLKGSTFYAIRAIAMSNTFDAVLALLFVFLAGMLLVHRALWPVLTRTLFRMADIGTKGRRAILTTVGFALLGASVFGGKFPELLQKLIEKLGG
jgi:hypothetical protein